VDVAPRPHEQQTASAGEGGGEGGRGEGREGMRASVQTRSGVHADAFLRPRGRAMSAQTSCCVRADALCPRGH
jgi:hypothetical protein